MLKKNARSAMRHALDHLVLVVRNLDVAAARYAAMGFTVGPRNHHPFGTANRLVQMHGGFLELVSVADPARLPPHAPGQFSFAAEVADRLRRGEGMAMLALATLDASADAARIAKAGFGAFEPFRFSREAEQSEGPPATLGFVLAFARTEAAPDVPLFTCQHLNPAAFWRADLMAHPNSARNIAAVEIVAENPSDHHIFLGSLVGTREMHATSRGVTLDTGGGIIEVLTPAAYRDQTGAAFDLDGRAAAFAGFRVAVANLEAVRAHLSAAALPFRPDEGKIFVSPATAFGCTITFAET